ncbi:MAG: hypothetical protein ACRD1G_16725, partial [Acidimicrobiales bacterium]
WWGWAGGGLVDVERRPKATYGAIKEASRPVLVATSVPNSVWPNGTTLDFPISIVNERRLPAEVEVHWRWLRPACSLVVGVDEGAREAVNAVDLVTPNAMVAFPVDGADNQVLSSGIMEGSVSSQSVALLGSLSLTMPADELSAATLEMAWTDEGREESNWFHVLGAPHGWFCGPGAWTISSGKLNRLGYEQE